MKMKMKKIDFQIIIRKIKERNKSIILMNNFKISANQASYKHKEIERLHSILVNNLKDYLKGLQSQIKNFQIEY